MSGALESSMLEGSRCGVFVLKVQIEYVIGNGEARAPAELRVTLVLA